VFPFVFFYEYSLVGQNGLGIKEKAWRVLLEEENHEYRICYQRLEGPLCLIAVFSLLLVFSLFLVTATHLVRIFSVFSSSG